MTLSTHTKKNTLTYTHNDEQFFLRADISTSERNRKCTCCGLKKKKKSACNAVTLPRASRSTQPRVCILAIMFLPNLLLTTNMQNPDSCSLQRSRRQKIVWKDVVRERPPIMYKKRVQPYRTHAHRKRRVCVPLLPMQKREIQNFRCIECLCSIIYTLQIECRLSYMLSLYVHIERTAFLFVCTICRDGLRIPGLSVHLHNLGNQIVQFDSTNESRNEIFFAVTSSAAHRLKPMSRMRATPPSVHFAAGCFVRNCAGKT